jgi:hypothetical protein
MVIIRHVHPERTFKFYLQESYVQFADFHVCR